MDHLGVSENQPLQPAQIADTDVPRKFVPRLLYGMVQRRLGGESVWRNVLTPILKDIGIMVKELPFWLRYVLLPEEERGLRSVEKGQWGGEYCVATKTGVEKTAQHALATGMMWEMTKTIGDGKKTLTNRLDVSRASGEVIPAITTEPVIVEWPMVVRTLIQDREGMPIKFVDVRIQRSNVDTNPFAEVDWERLMAGDEVYMDSLGERLVDRPRYLDEWYDEKVDNNSYGNVATPHILLGRNTKKMTVDQVTCDRRIILGIGLDPWETKCVGISVTSMTHTPFVGHDMMGREKGEKAGKELVAGAWERVMDMNEWDELADRTLAGSTKVSQYESNRADWKRCRGALTSGLMRADKTNNGKTYQMESAQRAASFESLVMAEFAEVTDGLRVLVEGKLDPELALLLEVLPGEWKANKIEVNRVHLVNLAILLHTLRAQGFAIGLAESISYSTIGPDATRKILDASRTMEANTALVRGNVDTLITVTQLINSWELFQKKRGAKSWQEWYQQLHGNEELVVVARLRQLYEQDLARARQWVDGKKIEMEELVVSSDYPPEQELASQAVGRIWGAVGMIKNELQDLKNGSPEQRLEEANKWASVIMHTVSAEGILSNEQVTSRMVDILKDSNVARWSKGEIIWDKRATMPDVRDTLDRLGRGLAHSIVDEYHQNGWRMLLTKEKGRLEQLDEAGWAELNAKLVDSLGGLKDLTSAISQNDALGIIAIAVRLGKLSQSEALGVALGAGQIPAGVRPESNLSKLVVKLRPGFGAMFKTAGASHGTTCGWGMLNNSMTIIDEIDHPRNMREIVLPWVRGNQAMRADLLRVAKNMNLTDHKIALINEMLEGSKFACFTDVNWDDVEQWGEKYREEQLAAVLDAGERSRQWEESEIFFQVFNKYLTEVKNRDVEWFRGGGMSELWQAKRQYDILAVQAKLAQVMLIVSSRGHADPIRLNQIRAIHARMYALARQGQVKLKEIYGR